MSDSEPHFDTNWNDLPIELKTMIVKKVDHNCRLSLRLCSKTDQKLVDAIPFRAIHMMNLYNEEDRWILINTRTKHGCVSRLEFKSFDDFQKKLTQELLHTDYVKELHIVQKENSKELKLSVHSGNFAKIGHLVIFDDFNNPFNYISQVNPVHLKRLACQQPSQAPDIFELPQVVHAELTIHGSAFITDEQLLKLEGERVYLGKCSNLTSSGINEYIKKCILNMEKKQVDFKFEFDPEKIIIEKVLEGIDISKKELNENKQEETIVMSTSGNFKLAFRHDENRIIGKITKEPKADDQNTFKTVDSLTILSMSPESFALSIEAHHKTTKHYELNSVQDVQAKLTEEMKNIDYIRTLTIWNASNTWTFRSDGKQITVGKLVISVENDAIEFLRQIEPIHLKELEVVGKQNVEEDNEMTGGELFDTPQVKNAEQLKIVDCFIRDDQLHNFNAVQLEIRDDKFHHITYSGINQFLKKLLSTLDVNDHNFQIDCSLIHGESSQMLTGLEIFSTEQIYGTTRKIIINSPHPKFQFQLTVNEGSMTTLQGMRIEEEFI